MRSRCDRAGRRNLDAAFRWGRGEAAADDHKTEGSDGAEPLGEARDAALKENLLASSMKEAAEREKRQPHRMSRRELGMATLVTQPQLGASAAIIPPGEVFNVEAAPAGVAVAQATAASTPATKQQPAKSTFSFMPFGFANNSNRKDEVDPASKSPSTGPAAGEALEEDRQLGRFEVPCPFGWGTAAVTAATTVQPSDGALAELISSTDAVLAEARQRLPGGPGRAATVAASAVVASAASAAPEARPSGGLRLPSWVPGSAPHASAAVAPALPKLAAPAAAPAAPQPTKGGPAASAAPAPSRDSVHGGPAAAASAASEPSVGSVAPSPRGASGMPVGGDPVLGQPALPFEPGLFVNIASVAWHLWPRFAVALAAQLIGALVRVRARLRATQPPCVLFVWMGPSSALRSRLVAASRARNTLLTVPVPPYDDIATCSAVGLTPALPPASHVSALHPTYAALTPPPPPTFLFSFTHQQVFLATPRAFGRVLDAVSSGTAAGSGFAGAVVVLGSLYAGQCFAALFQTWLLSDAVESLATTLRSAVFRSGISQDVAYFDGAASGELTSRLSSDVAQIASSVSSSARGTRAVVDAVGALLVLSCTSLKLTLVACAVVPFVVALSQRFGLRVKQLSKRAQAALATSQSLAEESFLNVRTIKAFSREHHAASKYDAAAKRAYRLAARIALQTGFLEGLTRAAGNVSALVILAFGGTLVAAGELSVGGLTSFVIYTLYISSARALLPAQSRALPQFSMCLSFLQHTPISFQLHCFVRAFCVTAS